jgi:hypothetical protein
MAALVDDAAVFPPGSAAVPDALRDHRAWRRSDLGVVVGPLLVPVSRLGEVLDALDADPVSEPLDLSLVADTGLVEAGEARSILLDDDRVELVGLELALPADGPLDESARLTLDTLDFALPAAIEIPLVAGWGDALAVLAHDGAERAKFRTGGAAAAAHPSAEQLAEVVASCVRLGAAFKLTAGLHRALRHPREDGVLEHGFVNVLAATAAALDGRSVAHLAALLDERDPVPLLAVLADADPVAVRRRFTSFGSCSISEPVDDMRALGLLTEVES